jgi:hypothetical protein
MSPERNQLACGMAKPRNLHIDIAPPVEMTVSGRRVVHPCASVQERPPSGNRDAWGASFDEIRGGGGSQPQPFSSASASSLRAS